MDHHDFTTTFTVDNSPEEAFAAINDVRGWWSQEVVGRTTELGDVFTFEVPGAHRTTQTITESIPGERVVWHVSDGWIGFVEDTTEWNGTDIVFDITDLGGRTEVRFTHAGLVPSVECFDVCSGAWSAYMTGSLRRLITTGTGDPHRAGGDFDSETAKHRAVEGSAAR
jgi:hypothetical protein